MSAEFDSDGLVGQSIELVASALVFAWLTESVRSVSTSTVAFVLSCTSALGMEYFLLFMQILLAWGFIDKIGLG